MSVFRGYSVNLTSAGSELYLKVDVCSRVLRLETFLETMKNTGSIKDKTLMNETFKNSSVIARYGNHRIHQIVEIDYKMTPMSTFSNER